VVELEKYVAKVLEQKRKYHAKVLSDSALYVNMIRSFDTYDLFANDVWFLSDLFTHISISLIETLGIDPTEIEQLSLLFDAKLPSLDELLQGIMIKFEKVTPPEITKFFEFVERNIKEEYQEGYKEKVYAKGIYGVSKYGKAYYDPVNVMRFIVNVLQRLFLEKPDLTRFREIIDFTAEQLGVSKNLAHHIFNRISLLHSVLSESFILGYGILGRTRLAEHGSEATKVPVYTYDREIINVRFKKLDEVHNGFILGLSTLGFSYLTPREGVYKKPSPEIVKYVSKLAFNAISRYRLTSWAIGNYNKPEEQKDFRKSERADQYMSLQFFRMMLENIVDGVLEKEKLSSVMKRQYKNAVLHLLALRTKRHKWGYTPFKEMSSEELKNWWINYWAKQGLNSSLLEKIYRVIEKWLPRWEQEKQSLQELVQLRRKFQALYR